MTPFDLVVTGGELVTSGLIRRASIGISAEKVAVIADPLVALPAREVLDASGMLVLPGIVDAHVHMREPGFAHKEGFATGTMAAAAGGVTTVMVMPTTNPPTLTPKDFEDKVRLAQGAAYVDFALQAGVGDDLSYIESLAEIGVVSFELFLAEHPPPLLVKDNGVLREILTRIAKVGSVAGITHGDDGIVRAMMDQVQAEGSLSPRAWARSRPPSAEALGVARACLLAADVGARVHLREISCRSSIEVLRAVRDKYHGLSAETTPHHLLLCEDELDKQGPFGKVWPPLRSPAEVEAVWEALLNGTIDIIATDHAPHLLAEKENGRTDIWKAPSGFPGLQTFLPLILDQVAKRRLSIIDLVRRCSEVPARLFDLYPRKGGLEPGSDADLVVVDPARTMTIENEAQLSKARYTPFAGLTVTGTPVLTMVRGQVVMRDGTIMGRPSGTLVTPLKRGGPVSTRSYAKAKSGNTVS